MKAKDVMTTHVITATDTSTVRDVASVLVNNGISGVPVVDSSGKLVGMASEGDLMHRAESGTGRQRSWWLSLLMDTGTLAAEFVKEHSRKVTDVMTREVVTATPDTPLGEIARLMETNGIKRMPIVADGKLVGIVSRANLVQALAAASQEIEPTIGLDDLAIRDRLLARLKAEAWTPSWLNVTVQHGVVELWGTARSESQKEAARVAAELTPGVVAVKDNILLRPAVYD